MASVQDNRFVWFCSAGKYRARRGGGSFSPSELVSQHKFGWDLKQQSFALWNYHGFAGSVYNRLPAPVELAEAFLLRCMDERFRHNLFEDFYPREDAIETIEAGDARLRLMRPKSVYRSAHSELVGISLRVEKAGVPQLGDMFLFYDLRVRFGAHAKTFTPDYVRTSLRAIEQA